MLYIPLNIGWNRTIKIIMGKSVCVKCGSTFCVKKCCETGKNVCIKCRWVSPSGKIYLNYNAFKQKVDRIIYGRNR